MLMEISSSGFFHEHVGMACDTVRVLWLLDSMSIELLSKIVNMQYIQIMVS